MLISLHCNRLLATVLLLESVSDPSRAYGTNSWSCAGGEAKDRVDRLKIERETKKAEAADMFTWMVPIIPTAY